MAVGVLGAGADGTGGEMLQEKPNQWQEGYSVRSCHGKETGTEGHQGVGSCDTGSEEKLEEVGGLWSNRVP